MGCVALVGSQGLGKFVQDGGAHNITNDLVIGRDSIVDPNPAFGGPPYGTYDFNDGTLTAGGMVVVGDFGNGTFNQNADLDLSLSAGLVIGRNLGGVGTYDLATGATLIDDVIVGDAGTGTFNNTSATHDVLGNLILGNQTTGEGTYNLSDPGVLSTATTTVSNDLIVGNFGKGTVIQNDSTSLMSVTKNLLIGEGTGSTGIYSLNDGSYCKRSDSWQRRYWHTERSRRNLRHRRDYPDRRQRHGRGGPRWWRSDSGCCQPFRSGRRRQQQLHAFRWDPEC